MFTDRSKAVLFLWNIFVILVFVMFLRQYIAALWSLAGKELTSWLSFVMFKLVFVTFTFGILGQM